MKEILLTRGQHALVDDDDFERLSQHRWCASPSRNGRFYAARRAQELPGRPYLFMHRDILPGVSEVDHFNRNTLDNQRHNLRAATRSQNQGNTGRPSTNTSGFKGVTRNRKCGKWQAQIKLDGQNHYLGLFSDVKEAAHAYDEAARRYFGEFACPNFLGV